MHSARPHGLRLKEKAGRANSSGKVPGALGIMPYISATIILQLLTAVIPTLSKLAREEGGRTKIIQYGRYLTVLLCFGWGLATAIGWENPAKIFGEGIPNLILYPPSWI